MKTTLITIATMFIKTLVIFFAPIKGIVVIIALSVILDTIFGRWKVKKLNDPENQWCSKKMRFGMIEKSRSYLMLIILVYVADYFLVNDVIRWLLSSLKFDFIATRVCAIVMVGVEMQSIDESWKAVKGWSLIERGKSMILDLIRKFRKVKDTVEP